MSAVIALMGPTASGKSALAMQLALHLPVEIISVDSAQVYRGMDIGTAKPSATEQAAVVHHLLDIRDPADPYSAADFVSDVNELIPAIVSRGHVPLLVGGTMLYFKALKDGLADMPAADASVRSALLAEAEANGWASLHDQLREVDPQAAARIRVSDRQRLQRALEVWRLTGKKISELQREGTRPGNVELVELALMPPDRTSLHAAIAERFGAMLDAGLVAEVTRLFARGDLDAQLPAIRAVGYRQVWAMLSGELDEAQMVLKAEAATRQLAKRQMTWLRSWQDVHLLTAPDVGETLKILKAASILDKVGEPTG